jgi:peptidyl-prolyl cis-trans isomerase SurA
VGFLAPSRLRPLRPGGTCRRMQPRRLATVLLVFGLLRGASAEVVNRIIATIDGDPVTQRDLDQFVKDRKAEGQDRQTVIQALITDKLLEREIKSAGIEVKGEEVDRAIAEIRMQNHMDDGEFQKAIQAQGFTLEGFRRKVKEEMERNELVNREVRSRVNVSPQEIERYYEAHKDDYAGGDAVTLSDIVIRPVKNEPEAVQQAGQMAAAVAAEARSGNFSELAQKYSQVPSAREGGLLGTFQKDELDPRLATAAFKMKVGEVSDPIPTPTGLHIIRVEKFSTASGKGGLRKLDDVKDDIREQLYKQMIGERFQEFLSTTLRDRHHVELLD